MPRPRWDAIDADICEEDLVQGVHFLVDDLDPGLKGTQEQLTRRKAAVLEQLRTQAGAEWRIIEEASALRVLLASRSGSRRTRARRIPRRRRPSTGRRRSIAARASPRRSRPGDDDPGDLAASAGGR
jgi:hypothetical protein